MTGAARGAAGTGPGAIEGVAGVHGDDGAAMEGVAGGQGDEGIDGGRPAAGGGIDGAPFIAIGGSGAFGFRNRGPQGFGCGATGGGSPGGCGEIKRGDQGLG